ncbi:hypothetical protein E6P70_04085 [Moraxella nonliquefaciens]|uniref:hypothetical protein n=1 Tax=Moraxella nonliquefaciens TaxID=478 RepID=UPI0024A6DDDB|nr:hypothetical protein [Moraxella nonliquefaciens]MDI4498026.1 hypothetical protein [Moraxella nonliquefaciens]MDI4499789.1 hypothetical protein [Moraxella nonliquefaciens]
MKIINSIEDLYGILNPYIDKPLSDDNIDDAIRKALFEKYFKSCPTYETMDWETFKNIQWQSSIDDNGKLIIKRVENDTNL